jgi:hypothetical protein
MRLVKPQLLSGETILNFYESSQDVELEKQTQIVEIENTDVDNVSVGDQNATKLVRNRRVPVYLHDYVLD